MGSVKMAKPILCIAHPRACSTAFERVFMTREDLVCFHEPFGDAFYFGPERMGSRYERDEASRSDTGFAKTTYKKILDQIESEGQEGKRIFVKDLSYYLVPPHGQQAEIAPSLFTKPRGIGTKGDDVRNGSTRSVSPPFPYGTDQEAGNPTPIPHEIWDKFHVTFLIRDPHSSVSSFYRCVIPPLTDITGWTYFDPSEMGYREQRRIFDYFVAKGQIGPKQPLGRANEANGVNGHTNGTNGHSNGLNGHSNGANGYHTEDDESVAEICVVDADDLLDDPEGIMREYCRSVNLEYDPGMLVWDTEEAHQRAVAAFEKWKGWHEDAIQSQDLKPRPAHKKKQRTEEQWDAEWKAKFGEEAAKMIRETVDANMADYLYLKQFTIKI